MSEFGKTSNMGVSEVADYISGSEISENKMADPKWRTYILKICLNSAKVEIWRFPWLVITDPKAIRVKTKWRTYIFTICQNSAKDVGFSVLGNYRSERKKSDNKMADPKWRTYILKIYQNSAKVEIWGFQWLVMTDPKAKIVKTKWRIHNGVTKLVTGSDNRV